MIVGGTIFILNTSMQWFIRRVLFLESFFAISIVFIISAICHFLLNNFFAFKDSNIIIKRKIIGYIIFLAISTLFNSILLFSFLTYIYDNVFIANVIVTSIMMLINFMILNKLIFIKQNET